jgi:hypothetical protein
MRAPFWLAPVALLILQSAPAGVVYDPDQRGYRIAVGASFGEYEEEGVNCDGAVVARERRKFLSAGADGAAKVSRRVMVAGHAGGMGAEREDGSMLAPPFRGFYGGVMAGYDADQLAFLVGVATAPGRVSADSTTMSNRVLPMARVRLGDSDHWHFLVELGGPPAAGAPPELGRVGVGYRLSQRPRFGFRVNVGVSDFPLGDQENHLLLDALVRLPLSQTLDLGLLATLRDPAGGNLGVFGQVRRR